MSLPDHHGSHGDVDAHCDGTRIRSAKSSVGSPERRAKIPVQLPSLRTRTAQPPEPTAQGREPEPERRLSGPEPDAPDGRDLSAQRGAGFPGSGYPTLPRALGQAPLTRCANKCCPRAPGCGLSEELGSEDSMGEGGSWRGTRARGKKTPAQSSQNKREPVPRARHILVLRICVPSWRPAAGPSPEGLRPSLSDPSPALPPVPRPCRYRFGFLLGREVFVESLGLLPAPGRRGLCPRPGLAGLPELPGFHDPAATLPARAGGGGDAALTGMGCSREARPGSEKGAGRAGSVRARAAGGGGGRGIVKLVLRCGRVC